MPGFALQAPAISQAELGFFHDVHFGPASIDHFATNFLPGHGSSHAEQAGHLPPDEAYQDEGGEDDGLGYYEDGVKRTLTEEQIAMFRHTELETMRRAQEVRAGQPTSQTAAACTSTTPQPDQDAEPGELPSDADIPSATSKVATKKKKRKRPKQRIEPEKPDLRKRTWDVVDTGLASLDYGDESHDSNSAPRPAQRRQISYDD